MITENDSRIMNSEYQKEFEKVAQEAMNHIRNNFMDYAHPPRIRGYSHSFKSYTMCKVFDELIMKHGFEIDARTLKHAHGIGNNNEWNIVDKNLTKVGSFYANNDMYQGVYLGVSGKNGIIDKFEICSGGFIRG